MYMLIACLFLLLLSFFFLLHPKPSDFPLNKKADFYLVTSQAIYAMVENEGKLTVIQQTKRDIAGQSFSRFSTAKLGEKLVFSKGWSGKGFENSGRAIVSLDFKTGKIHKTPSKHYAYTGAGYSSKYFYTWQSTTEDAQLSQFNSLGKETNTKHFPYQLISNIHFLNDTKGVFYLIATEDYTDYLLTISEKDLSILSKVSLNKEEGKHYRYSSSLVYQSNLYVGLHSVRDLASGNLAPDHRLLIKDLTTQEEKWINLSQPSVLSAFRSHNLLFFEHDSSELGRFGFTIFHPKTHASQFVDVSALINSQETEAELGVSSLANFTQLSDNLLLFTLEQQLICYDMERNEIIDSLSLNEEVPIHIWTKTN